MSLYHVLSCMLYCMIILGLFLVSRTEMAVVLHYVSCMLCMAYHPVHNAAIMLHDQHMLTPPKDNPSMLLYL